MNTRRGGKPRRQKKQSPTAKFVSVNKGRIGVDHQKIVTLMPRNPLGRTWSDDPETIEWRKRNRI